MLFAIYALSLGVMIAVAAGKFMRRVTPTARGVFVIAGLLMAYPFWTQGRDGADSELPLTLIAVVMAAGAILFAVGTFRREAFVWRVVEVVGVTLMTLTFAVPTRIVFFLPIVAAVLGWVIRRATGREVLMDPVPPRVSS